DFHVTGVQTCALPISAAFGLVDRLTLVATLLALACWSFLPESTEAAVALLVAAALQAARLARWRGHATLAEPLVWILHLAYAWRSEERRVGKAQTPRR